jgi:hypothetical protein
MTIDQARKLSKKASSRSLFDKAWPFIEKKIKKSAKRGQSKCMIEVWGYDIDKKVLADYIGSAVKDIELVVKSLNDNGWRASYKKRYITIKW